MDREDDKTKQPHAHGARPTTLPKCDRQASETGTADADDSCQRNHGVAAYETGVAGDSRTRASGELPVISLGGAGPQPPIARRPPQSPRRSRTLLLCCQQTTKRTALMSQLPPLSLQSSSRHRHPSFSRLDIDSHLERGDVDSCRMAISFADQVC